jgi:hypothetical protein
MLPIDFEFGLLYFGYTSVFLFFIIATFLTKRKVYIINLMVFLIYTSFMIYVFLDAENFKYGNSLVVLFYGGVFLIAHIAVCILIEFIKAIRTILA